MPYKIDVEMYCDGCPEFEVSIKEDTIYFDNLSIDPNETVTKVVNRAIECKHRKRCENMTKYLLKKLEKKLDKEKKNG